MIEFAGELSENNKKALNKIMTSMQFKATCIVSIIAAAAITYFVVTYNVIIALGYLPVIVLLIGSACPQSKKAEQKFCPKRIIINTDDGVIVSELGNTTIQKEIADVFEVIDFGDNYRIKFNHMDKAVHFVCQKNLLVRGTIEEFEKLFQDKLVHKS